MERLLFRVILAGFAFLTLTLLTGIVFSETLFGRAMKFDHKTVFAVVSWFIFAALLAGRYFYGWRGRTALRWTLAGFVALLLAYVGSRFVLEVILRRGPARALLNPSRHPNNRPWRPPPSNTARRARFPAGPLGVFRHGGDRHDGDQPLSPARARAHRQPRRAARLRAAAPDRQAALGAARRQHAGERGDHCARQRHDHRSLRSRQDRSRNRHPRGDFADPLVPPNPPH